MVNDGQKTRPKSVMSTGKVVPTKAYNLEGDVAHCLRGYNKRGKYGEIDGGVPKDDGKQR